jgi:hypothetical protein
MIVLSEGKHEAVSQTLLDCSKILLAALVAADFIKFPVAIRIIIVVGMIILIILGVAIRPDKL